MKKTLFLACKKTFSTGRTFIRNKELPLCLNCVHFIEHKNNYPYDPLPDDKIYSRCKKFGEVDIITGTIEYDFAKHCRDNIVKCGKTGSEYTQKPEYTQKSEYMEKSEYKDLSQSNQTNNETN